MFGPYFPGILRHKGAGLADLVSFTYSTTEGVFGLAMGTSATYIIIFVLFGSFLAKSGTGQLFVDLSLSATGKSKSGSAYATILSNALMGIISGSPVANVVTTGSFTLPLLRRCGYPMQNGAALLAVAACGSMFTPPVMGAAAFLIADYLSVPYGKVVLASLFPALLFYISLFVAANVGASKGGLKSLSRDEMPDWKAAVLDRGHLLIPIVLLVGLIVYGYSALKSAFFCVLLILVLTTIKKSTRMNWRKIKDSLYSGSRDALSIAAACACAGIIVGVVSSTGLGVKFFQHADADGRFQPVAGARADDDRRADPGHGASADGCVYRFGGIDRPGADQDRYRAHGRAFLYLLLLLRRRYYAACGAGCLFGVGHRPYQPVQNGLESFPHGTGGPISCRICSRPTPSCCCRAAAAR